MAEYRKVTTGAPLRIPAQTWNDVLDVTEAAKRARLSRDSGRQKLPQRARFVITGATKDGTNWRWTYSGKMSKRDEDFASVSFTGGPTYTLYNTIEFGNTNTGTVSGITLGDDGEVDVTGILPVPSGKPVWADLSIGTDGSLAYEFTWPNDPVAECSASENTQPPDSPGTVTPGTTNPNEVTLSWDAVTATDLNHYNVYQTETSGSGYIRNNTEPVTTNSYTATGLEPATTYYFAVTAVDTAGNESDYSDEVEVTTPDAPPEPPTLDDPSSMTGEGNITLYWLANSEPDIASYKVYRTTTSGSGYSLVDTVTHPTVQYTDSPGTTEYWYVITAVDADSNESDPSAEIHYPGIV